MIRLLRFSCFLCVPTQSLNLASRRNRHDYTEFSFRPALDWLGIPTLFTLLRQSFAYISPGHGFVFYRTICSLQSSSHYFLVYFDGFRRNLFRRNGNKCISEVFLEPVEPAFALAAGSWCPVRFRRSHPAGMTWHDNAGYC